MNKRMKKFVAHITVYHHINISKYIIRKIKAKNKEEATIEAQRIVDEHNNKSTVKLMWKLTHINFDTKFDLIFNQM